MTDVETEREAIARMAEEMAQERTRGRFLNTEEWIAANAAVDALRLLAARVRAMGTTTK